VLKEQAKQRLADMLDQAAVAATAPGGAGSYLGSGGSSSSGSGGVDTRQLRRKLEVAIQVMQTGLVERDTEVGGAAVVA
jgi:hypothetical protein